ncbi:MAG: ATP-binding protein, partial [Fimbriiglobus sp.]
VLAAAHSTRRRSRVLGCLTRRTARFVLDNDPALVCPLIELLRNDLTAVGVCDESTSNRVGVALEEALLNAIYHGNLEVSSDLKRDDEDAFHKLAAHRRTQAPYRDRRVTLAARLTPDRAVFVVADQGPGFDITKLPDPADEAALALPSGRGVLLMRMFMDAVTYNPTGNRVTLEKRRAKPDPDAVGLPGGCSRPPAGP